MNDTQNFEIDFLHFINLLYENNCLNHVILIGSWAEYLYEKTGILPEYNANIKTLDIDF